ncbi:MAG: ABC transporter ATP-binding protein [Chloroflexota bacterium]
MKIRTGIQVGTSNGQARVAFSNGSAAAFGASQAKKTPFPQLKTAVSAIPDILQKLRAWLNKLLSLVRDYLQQIGNKTKEEAVALRQQTRLTLAALHVELRYIERYWKPYWKAGALLVSSLLAYKLMYLGVAYGLMTVVDSITTVGATAASSGLTSLYTWGGALLLGFPLVWWLNLSSEKIIAQVSSYIANDLRADLFDHLQTLSYAFFKHSKPGDLSARFSSDTNLLLDAIGRRFIVVVASLLGLVITVPTLFIISWRLSVVVFLLFPLVIIALLVIAPQLIEATYLFKQTEGAVGNLVQESIHVQPAVKSFGVETAVSARFADRLDQLTETRYAALYQLALLRVSATQYLLITEILSAIAGGALVLNGIISAGALVAFLLVVDVARHDLSDIMKWNLPFMVYAMGAGQRLDEVLTETAVVSDMPDAYPLPPFQQAIRFEQVSFRYNDQQTGLHNVDFTIYAGQHIAIVGTNGAGKSTILSLLLRFYDVENGRITLDKHDIRDVTQASLRNQIAIVFQQPYLFDATIGNNIRLAQPTANDEEIIAAAQQAQIHDFITTLPNGYDTMIGEGGDLLSGGQKQKIAIARALLRNPAILIFDEVTSGLDTASRAAVNRTITANAAGRTVISITHDLGEIAAVDQIFVLENGRLVEQGTHDTLLAAPGTYAALWDKQH